MNIPKTVQTYFLAAALCGILSATAFSQDSANVRFTNQCGGRLGMGEVANSCPLILSAVHGGGFSLSSRVLITFDDEADSFTPPTGTDYILLTLTDDNMLLSRDVEYITGRVVLTPPQRENTFGSLARLYKFTANPENSETGGEVVIAVTGEGFTFTGLEAGDVLRLILNGGTPTPATAVARADDDAPWAEAIGGAIALSYFANYLIKQTTWQGNLFTYALPTSDDTFAYGMRVNPNENWQLGLKVTNRSYAEIPQDPYYDLKVEYRF